MARSKPVLGHKRTICRLGETTAAVEEENAVSCCTEGKNQTATVYRYVKRNYYQDKQQTYIEPTEDPDYHKFGEHGL